MNNTCITRLFRNSSSKFLNIVLNDGNVEMLYGAGGEIMNGYTLTQTEAEELLKLAKLSLISILDFPEAGQSKEFDVIGDTSDTVFTVLIYRGKIKLTKYNIGARIKKNSIVLLELHINPSNVHYNPDGSKIVGSHWHIYTEKYGRQLAFPAENVKDENYIINTLAFLDRFNVIKKPEIQYSMDSI